MKRPLVMVNGCFDLLHLGHICFLQEARKLGSALAVAINSDRSVRQLKGKSRPIVSQWDRSSALLALSCVDYVFIFDQIRATNIIGIIRPNIYAKAADYSLETMNPRELAELRRIKAKIFFVPMLAGYSTTSLIKKIQHAASID